MPLIERPNGATIFYETYGDRGPKIFLGAPLVATRSAEFPTDWEHSRAVVEDLRVDHRLVIVDYPSGRGRSTAPDTSATCGVSRVTEDMLAVADAAGFDKFLFFGYSWGAACGMQLALRTERLTGLIAGGFPPLDGPYELLLRSCQHWLEHPVPGAGPELLRQFVRFYEDLQSYDDHLLLPQISVPCMTFVGDRDDIDVGVGRAPVYANTEKNRRELEKLGWQVRVLPGDDHDSAMLPQKILPMIREFVGSKGVLRARNADRAE
jgi:pimeloyl-ACP methyl ester carboxylesterase